MSSSQISQPEQQVTLIPGGSSTLIPGGSSTLNPGCTPVQGLLNSLRNIPNAISTAFAAPAGTTVPVGDPQYRQPGFFSINCGAASLSFKLGPVEVSLLKMVGVIIIGGVASFGLMKLVAVARVMFSHKY